MCLSRLNKRQRRIFMKLGDQGDEVRELKHKGNVDACAHLLLDMQVTLHIEIIVMQVTLHYEAIMMQVTLHDKRIVMQVTLHYEAIVMQVTLHDKRIVMQVMLHYEVIIVPPP
ncbi:hypothetical protein Tco_0851306 [Tanacetum coccineum]